MAEIPEVHPFIEGLSEILELDHPATIGPPESPLVPNFAVLDIFEQGTFEIFGFAHVTIFSDQDPNTAYGYFEPVSPDLGTAMWMAMDRTKLWPLPGQPMPKTGALPYTPLPTIIIPAAPDDAND